MPRKCRIHHLEAIYHVMLRGNYRQNIFVEHEDYKRFCSLLKKSVQQFNCKIHLYCLMSNHIHLVIEVQNVPLWKIIQTLASSHARFIHKRNDQTGHLFQGRYQAKIIHDDQYFLELCYYIHRNPINAKMVNNLDQYPWSSHHTYANQMPLKWLTIDHVNALLKKRFPQEKKPYLSFMSRKPNIEASPCQFDNDGFLVINDSITQKTKAAKSLLLSHLSITEIIQVICQYMEVDQAKLSSSNQHKKITLTRSLIAYFGHYYGHHYLNEIALYFNRNPDTVSRTLHRQLTSKTTNSIFARYVHAIENEFKKLLKLKAFR